MNYSLLKKGKRIRPALIYLCSGLPVADIKAKKDFITTHPVCLQLMIAVEMLHTYTIIHDDLPAMDNADFRRDQPSCHKQFNEWLAILAGDALQSRAFQIIAKIDYPPQKTIAFIEMLSALSGCAGVVGGQARDMKAQQQSAALTVKQKKNIDYDKTGQLFACCFGMGAILAQINEIATYQKYGLDFGVYFQRLNDLLDWGVTKKNSVNLHQEKSALETMIIKLKSKLQHLPISTKYHQDSKSLLAQMLDLLLKGTFKKARLS